LPEDELGFDDELDESEAPEYIAEPDLDDIGLLEEPEELPFEEELSEEPNRAIEEAPPAEAPLPGESNASEAGADDGAESILGEPTAELLEYLKGLTDDLPPEKKEEFDVATLQEKIDDLIGKIKEEAERAAEPPPPLPHESGVGLLSAGEALRAASDPSVSADPRRSILGRRSGLDRRQSNDRRSPSQDRRVSGDRRDKSNRRSGERRGPVPEIDLGERLPPIEAQLKVSPDGTPTEILGMTISPRMAKLISIIRQEKDKGNVE
jgi:hypothetical protein